MYSTISQINPDNTKSWNGKLFLSFDIDWAHDEIILDCYDLVCFYSVATTWFVTHKTEIIQIFKENKSIELGIHPNFNELLNGKTEIKNSYEILQKMLSIIPHARSIRSHSLTQSERLLDQFSEFGLSHVSNFFVPYSSGIHVKPFYLWNNTIIIPHTWQDNVALKMDSGFPEKKRLNQGFHVFDFHPIHVFLNTESLDRYERTRSLHHNPKELIKHRYEGYGTRNRLIELLELAKQS